MIQHGMKKLATLRMPGGVVSTLGRFLARGPGVPATLGAAAAGGAAYLTRPEGGDALSTLDRVGRAGLAGAAAGAGLGLGARSARDLQLLNPGKYTSMGHLLTDTGAVIGRNATNMVKRQIHGITGGYGDALDEIGLRGRGTAQKEIALARARAADQGTSKEVLAEQIKALTEHGEMGQAARNAGITSLPGTLQGLVSNPGATTKALYHDIVGGPGTPRSHKLMAGGAYVGLPAAAGAMDIARGDESEVGGATVRQKVLRHGADLATGVLTAGMPLGAGAAAQEFLTRPFGG